MLVVINEDCSQGYWVEFDIEKITPSKSDSWLEIPESNKLNASAKNALQQLAGEAKDFSE